MRETITATAIGAAAMLAQAAQSLPEDPTTWGGLVEKLGVIGLLCVFIFFLLKERAAVKIEHKDELAKKDARIAELEKKLEDMEERLDDTRQELRDVRQVVLASAPDKIDVTATTKRSLIRMETAEVAAGPTS